MKQKKRGNNLYEYIEPIKFSKINFKDYQTEIEADIELCLSKDSWSNCYFHKLGSDLLHPEGECISCDWEHYMKTVSKKDKENWNFIEAWEWESVWEYRQSSGYYKNKDC